MIRVSENIPSSNTSSLIHQQQKMEELTISAGSGYKRPRTSEDFLRFCDVVLSYANYPGEFRPTLSASYHHHHLHSNSNHIRLSNNNINNNNNKVTKVEDLEEEEDNGEERLDLVVNSQDVEEEEEESLRISTSRVINKSEQHQPKQLQTSRTKTKGQQQRRKKQRQRRPSGVVIDHSSNSNNNSANVHQRGGERIKLDSPLNSVGESARGSTRSSTSSTHSEDSHSSLDVDLDTADYDETWGMVTCWCGKPYAGRSMIECESCLVWLHMSCAGIKRQSVPTQFKCIRCDPNGGKESSSGNSSSGGGGGDLIISQVPGGSNSKGGKAKKRKRLSGGLKTKASSSSSRKPKPKGMSLTDGRRKRNKSAHQNNQPQGQPHQGHSTLNNGGDDFLNSLNSSSDHRHTNNSNASKYLHEEGSSLSS